MFSLAVYDCATTKASGKLMEPKMRIELTLFTAPLIHDGFVFLNSAV
jgi:hypothetical protein